MAFGFKNFIKGFRLVPVSTTAITEKGDIEVLDASGKINYFNGATASPVVTEAHTATLTNKILTGNTAVNLISGSGTFVFNTSGVITSPNTTDTLVGKNTTDILTNKTISGASNTLSSIGYSSLILTNSILNADISTSAAIARNKLASGSNNHVIINDGSGILTSEAQLNITRGGTGQATAETGFNALSPTTTKGDVIAHTGLTNARLPVGSDGQILTANSAQTTGLSWVNASTNPTIFGPVQNLGFTYSAGTFSITSADGTALSAGNPGYVYLQSKATPGELTRFTITANQSFIDGSGASEIIGNTFGTTASIAWANDCPFFVYAVTNDSETTIQFMISRDPRASLSPASAEIGTPSTPIVGTESSFFSFDNITTTSYDLNPCLVIGSIRLQKDASDDWTIQTLSNYDGIGKFQESTRFAFPQNQNGAAVGSHILLNGGTTVPQFNTENYFYYINRDGKCRVELYYEGDAGVDGVGAALFLMAVPFSDFGITGIRFPVYALSASAGSLISFFTRFSATSFALYSEAGNYQLNTFTNGNREISGEFTFSAFGN